MDQLQPLRYIFPRHITIFWSAHHAAAQCSAGGPWSCRGLCGATLELIQYYKSGLTSVIIWHATMCQSSQSSVNPIDHQIGKIVSHYNIEKVHLYESCIVLRSTNSYLMLLLPMGRRPHSMAAVYAIYNTFIFLYCYSLLCPPCTLFLSFLLSFYSVTNHFYFIVSPLIRN